MTNTDITKCNGEGCPVKESCYRYTSTPDEHCQSYFVETPGYYSHGKWNCGFIWEAEQERILTTLVQENQENGFY